MRIDREPAFVLHQHEYGETSLLLETFTRHHGRLGLLAKGARRARSPLRTTLVPFQPLLVSFSGRGELPVMSLAEPARAAPVLGGQALICGLYLNELLIRLLHRHDPHDRLFDVYGQTLDRLVGTQPDEAVLRIFEKRLLEETGYGLVLDHDVEGGGPLDPLATYHYLVDRGPVPAGSSADEGIVVQGATLAALGAERLDDPEIQREAKRLLRALLARQLGERTLSSRKLFRPVRDAHTVK